MCLYPQLITNPKYKPNKKNGGQVPPFSDHRVTLVPRGCGNCIECRKKKAREWQIRLMEDTKTNKNGKFITLTFSNESIQALIKQCKLEKLQGYQLDNEIATKAVHYFRERWRKKFKKSIRHWLITEIGHNGTENIHMHGIIWTDEPLETIRSIWAYGYIWPRTEEVYRKTYVNDRTINYITKYMTKRDIKHKTYKSIVLTSPGIGGLYKESPNAGTNKYNNDKTNETYTTRTGHKIALPTYWRNAIYSEEEREQLWINKLNENTRYVCGEKVNADDEKAYRSLVEYHRQRNIEMGYGSDEKDYDQEEYERQRRMLKYDERKRKK